MEKSSVMVAWQGIKESCRSRSVVSTHTHRPHFPKANGETSAVYAVATVENICGVGQMWCNVDSV